MSINGEQPRDVIRYQLLADEADPIVEVDRGGLTRTIEVAKEEGEPLGIEVQAAVFDQIRTCDNHCSFCFIYQLPPGMRRSLYLKDDDYRLSFLYGNFTTLTRFTEADLERVVTENLSPLYVSIHTTDPALRASMLRNRRGATSLRWLRALLDHGMEVHGQVVVCPGVNDGAALDHTLLGVLDEYPELASVAVVPLGVSDHSEEGGMRPHTATEAGAVIELVAQWQEIYRRVLGHRLVHAADEYYLLAEQPFPAAETYEGFSMHEDGIGMARNFEAEFTGASGGALTPKAGFFAWVDGAPAEGYRAPRRAPVSGAGSAAGGGCAAGAGSVAGSGSGADAGCRGDDTGHEGGDGPVGGRLVRLRPGPSAPLAILTSSYGARVLGPILAADERGSDARLVVVDNQFFGGNIAVTGLMVGADVARVLTEQPIGHRYLLPDVCLSGGRFLDGVSVDELPRPVEVLETSGSALRAALAAGAGGSAPGRRVEGTALVRGRR
jgi:NifB/MoaA-like Fe-S oxidoreductase